MRYCIFQRIFRGINDRTGRRSKMAAFSHKYRGFLGPDACQINQASREYWIADGSRGFSRIFSLEKWNILIPPEASLVNVFHCPLHVRPSFSRGMINHRSAVTLKGKLFGRSFLYFFLFFSFQIPLWRMTVNIEMQVPLKNPILSRVHEALHVELCIRWRFLQILRCENFFASEIKSFFSSCIRIVATLRFLHSYRNF